MQRVCRLIIICKFIKVYDMTTKTKYQSGIVAGGNFHLDIGNFKQAQKCF